MTDNVVGVGDGRMMVVHSQVFHYRICFKLENLMLKTFTRTRSLAWPWRL